MQMESKSDEHLKDSIVTHEFKALVGGSLKVGGTHRVGGSPKVGGSEQREFKPSKREP